jgi:hypothetical protein
METIMAEMTRDSNDLPVASPAPKRQWHPPTLEEVDYTATEVGGAPGGFIDGVATYSIV